MKESTPRVSVVIPTYNRPDYLRISLASVVNQSYRNIEIIVQDNASDTDPAPLIASFGDPRIRLSRNERNLGLFANFLAGYRQVRGDFVATLADDDVWHPEFLATLVPKLEEDRDIVIAFCDHEIIDEHNKVDRAVTNDTTRRWGRHLLKEGTYRPFHEIALIHRSICSASAAVYRRADVDMTTMPREVGVGLDLYLSYLATRTGRACYYTPQRLAQFRYHPHTVTNQLKETDQRIESARSAVFYWNQFLIDPVLTSNRHYFEMKRGFNALRIVLAELRKGEPQLAFAQLKDYIDSGYLRPSIFFYHLIYAVRLRRATA